MAVATQMPVAHGRCTAGRVIPAFGNWDTYYSSGGGEDGGLPITQYFETARAAGLSRGQQHQECLSFRKDLHGYNCCHDYHSAYGHQLPPYLRSYHYQYCNQKRRVMMRNTDSREDLWWEKRRKPEEGPLMARHRRRDYPCSCDQQKATAARKAAPSTANRTVTPRLTQASSRKMAAVRPTGSRAPKAVDEDLYKIPPELLRLHQRAKSRRSSILRAWSCMGILCVK